MEKVKISFTGKENFISPNHLLTVRDSGIMKIAAIADLEAKQLVKHGNAMPVGYYTGDYKKFLAEEIVFAAIDHSCRQNRNRSQLPRRLPDVIQRRRSNDEFLQNQSVLGRNAISKQ